jgi:putative transposase
MEEAVVGECQRAVHAWIEDGSQSREPGQGGGTVPADRQAANGAGVAQKNLSSCDPCEFRKLVDSNYPELSVSCQCEILGLPRSTHYYRPTPVRESILGAMARIDALYREDPCSGSRRMVDYLAREGIPISRDRVRNLMRRRGLRAIYQKPRTTMPCDPSERYPCLLDLN